MAVQRRRIAWTHALALGAFLQSCQSPSADAPMTAPNSVPTFARGATGPTVSAANPASARQGTVTLDVQISGSGFDDGSQASWQLNGVPYPKIAVNGTKFLSSTSLTANITIAVDAAPVTYDIAVVTRTGKKGIGAELFTVTYAVAIPGMTEGDAINDAGQIVGYNGTAIVLSDPTLGIVPVAAAGNVWDIDRNGRTIGGRDADGYAVLWTSSTGPGGPWTASRMRSLGSTGAVRGIASDPARSRIVCWDTRLYAWLPSSAYPTQPERKSSRRSSCSTKALPLAMRWCVTFRSTFARAWPRMNIRARSTSWIACR